MDEHDTSRWQKAKAAAQEAVALAPRLVGLTESDARSAAEVHGFAFRITARDGVSLPHRTDRRLNRINATVENGTIVAASVG